MKGEALAFPRLPLTPVPYRWHEAWTLAPTDPIFALPASSLRTLNAYRDMRTIKASLPSVRAFQLAHRSIKYFAQSHGIYGSRLGYLGGIHITLMLARVAFENHTSSAGQLVQAFFRTYAEWDWASSPVTVPSLSQGSYTRSEREPLAILSLHKPTLNVAALASVATTQVIAKEIRLAQQGFDARMPWSSICGSRENGKTPLHLFLKGYPSYLKVEVAFWGRSCTAGRALVGFLESRLSRVRASSSARLEFCTDVSALSSSFKFERLMLALSSDCGMNGSPNNAPQPDPRAMIFLASTSSSTLR